MKKLNQLLLIAFLTQQACTTSQTLPLEAMREIPAAQGEVKIETGVSTNNEVELKVKHLAQAQTVSQTTSVYVVWVVSSIGDPKPQNMGVLTVNENLTGKHKFKTPFRHFTIFVTPEPSSEVTSPSGLKLLSIKHPINLEK